jgi:hypothetical protein
MTGLAERLLEQLRRLGSMSVVAVPLTFGVTEDDASAAIAELLEGKQAYRAGARVFASTASSSSGPTPLPAGPPRQVKAPPTAPQSRPVMNPPAQAEARNRAMRDLTIADSAAARKDYRGTVTEPEARPVSATARAASIAAAAVPRESNQEATMAETKVCSKCEKRKSIDDFYSGQGKCKRCFLDDQKASKLARAAGAGGTASNEGGGSARPKSAAPAKPTAGAKANGAASKIEDVAVIHIANGFRLGPLHKTTAGLVHMPYYVDLSFEQLEELVAVRKENRP